jgi:trk system potassium uptake protein TrkH
MRLRVVQRIVGLLLMVFSGTLLPPAAVGLLFGDDAWLAFVEAFGLTLLAGSLVWWPVRNDRAELRLRDGFLVVALFWTVLGSFGAVPFLLSEWPSMSFTDAMFESVSGLTTTGATVLTELETLPPSILFYRQQLQWLGGMGIIVLAVAILPMLGVGGMQLYRAETPGPVKDTKLTPRITETAKALWYVYLGITVACGTAYWAAGMDVFDAVCHAFSTVAIGGFSTYDASIGHFDSVAIELIAIVFMFLAGANFSLHFLAWRSASLAHYARDPEFVAYAWFLGAVAILVCGYLVAANVYASSFEAIVKGLFQAVSIATTTGFTTDQFATWPGTLPVLLILTSFVGACAGSTGGGMKVIRWLLVFKQGLREIKRLVHPNAEIAVKLGQKAVGGRIVEAVWGFVAVYMVVYAVLLLLLIESGLDQVTAFSAVAATLNNLGPGLGGVAGGFGEVGTLAKWASMLAMLLGRLEIFTLLVLFTPTFWRR